MLLFLKSRSSSRTVHHFQDEDEAASSVCNKNITASVDEEEGLCSCSSNDNISLTVWRKSLVFSCKGFTVIGSDGSLAYRVDNYTGHPNHTLLMDGSGDPIFTVCRRRKKLRLVDNCWLVYEGEVGDNKMSKKPAFCVRKCTSIVKTKPLGVLAYVYAGGNSGKGYAYIIEGSYVQRSCKISDDTGRVVAEIKTKEVLQTATGGVSFGLEVFQLIVLPGIDSRFAMALVLLLDQMFS